MDKTYYQILSERLNRSGLAQVVLENAQAHPAKSAIDYDGATLSYKELSDRVQAIAALMRTRGLGAGDMVGVLVSRGPDLVPSLLGVNLCGAGYVPLDPSFPSSRLEYIIADSGITHLLCDAESTVPGIENLCQRIYLADIPTGKFSSFEPVAEQSLAYSIYTSGSTGKPKGVLIHRGALHNFLASMAREPGLSDKDLWLAVTTPSFDIAALELFLPLLVGGSILLASESDRRDGAKLANLLNSHPVTVMQATPATWQMLLDADWTGTPGLRALCGGETLTPRLATQLVNRCDELWNMYGPTETTVWSSCKRIDKVEANTISVGGPIDNTYFRIFDQDMCLVPDGQSGELYIGGDGVALGYSSPELTDKQFCNDPSQSSEQKQRLYRTGDRAHVFNGELFVEGRLDLQIKIRGYRVESSEIEAAIDTLVTVRQSIVVQVTRPDGRAMLCAAVRIDTGASFDSAEIARSLRQRLPDYMIPEQFSCLTEFPKTPNDKVDRLKLTSMLAEQITVDGLDIRDDATPQELARALILSATGTDHLDPHANLFDQGLTSLQANWVAAQLSHRTGQRYSVSALFENPTLYGFLRNSKSKPTSPPKPKGKPNTRSETACNDGIAVIAMSGRFPGADTIEELWQLLIDGREGVTKFSPDQDDPVAKKLWGDNPDYKRVRGMIRNPDMFDAELFGISPNDAKAMDPQQRVFLELSWEAFERAGYGAGHGDMRVGSFAGMGNNFYYHYNVSTHPDHIALIGEVQAEIGREKDHIATLVSHKLNLKGPSLSIHTACSTALVAIDSACQALWSGQCDMALAGGIELRTPQFSGHVYEPDGIFTGDGHCRPFSKDASGTMFSDSAGILILKRLKDAQADSDSILAVICGSATNHDGFEKQSYLAPSIAGQIDVIETAHRRGGITADSISYIEAHGTGTLVGDPIEFEALRRVFEQAGAEKQKCAIGSVKANLGHPTTAAGVVGVIKTIMAMQHGIIPPLANFTGINPNIDIENSPFFIPEQPLKWNPGSHPRRAGISSFGFCGTNAHVVIEEYVPVSGPEPTTSKDCSMPIVLSAQNDSALEKLQSDITEHLTKAAGDLEKVAYTLAVGRRRLAKAVIIPAQRQNGILHFADPVRVSAPLTAGLDRFRGRVGFLFPGQGAQYTGMGQTLREQEPAFRAAFDECAALMSDEMGENLLGVMFGQVSLAKDVPPLINNTYYTQPSIFCLEYALARLWQSWGVEPDFIIGHSIGEFVGATIAGVFDLDEGVRAIASRARLVRDLPTGSMLSVRLSEDELTPLMPDALSLAAVNGPKLCVVAGPHDDIRVFAQDLDRKGIHQKLLHTSHAFHSFMMDSAVAPFRQLLDGLNPWAPSIPIISTVTGETLSDDTARNLDYWAEHLRKPVRFASAVQFVLADQAPALLIEVGPRSTLSSLGAQMLTNRANQATVASLLGPESNLNETQSVIAAFGRILRENPSLADSGFFADHDKRRVPLPTYPFQRKSYWLEPTWLPGDGAVNRIDAAEAEVLQSDAANQTSYDTIIDKLETILADISGLDLAGMDPNSSFVELGLDSLLLTPLTFKVRQSFGTKVSFRQLFRDLSTPDTLARHIVSELVTESAKDAAPPPTPSGPAPKVAAPARDLALSAQQSLHRTVEAAGRYSVVLKFGCHLDIATLVSNLGILIQNHDVLRARLNAGHTTQSFTPDWQLDLRILKGQTMAPERAALCTAGPLDSTAPALQATYQEDGLGMSWLRLTTPSWLCDIWSMDVLIENLAKLFRNGPSAIDRGTQARFAEVIQSPTAKTTPESNSRFWEGQINRYACLGAKPAATRMGTATRARCVIEGDALNALRAQAAQCRQSLLSVLTHRCAVALHRYAPDPARLFALTMAGQPFFNEQSLVGQCANIVPIGIDPATASYTDIHEAMTTAYENQLSSKLFWQTFPPGTLGSSLIRITHIKRLTPQQTDFGLPFQDYWFDLMPDSQFAQLIVLIEGVNRLEVDLCSFDGALPDERLKMVATAITQPHIVVVDLASEEEDLYV